MKIETYCLAYNEDFLMPYFRRHYEQFSNIIMLDEVWDEVDERKVTDIKNNCWKESKADWVIIADADEFVYSPWLLDILSRTKDTIFAPDYYDMYSDVLPSGSGQIYDEVFMGKKDKTKMNIFRPSEIKEMNYDHGCHRANPTGNVSIAMSLGVRTLHMRYLSIEWVLERNKRVASRLSVINRKMGWGYHTEFPKEKVIEDFNEAKKHLIDVRL